MKDYLANRTQFVNIGDFYRTKHEISVGVPQGSNLGPLLFLVFINDIFLLNLSGKIVLYADDTVVMYHSQNISELQNMMQEDLNTICDWLNHNKLTMNCEKTKYVLMGTQLGLCNSQNFNLRAGNTLINRVESFKYLGLTIQQNTKWDTHVTEICKKKNGISGVIHRIGANVYTSVLKAVYHAHVNSHLTHLISIWGPATSEYNLNLLQICQNNAIRRVFRREYMLGHLHTAQIMKKYGILNVRSLMTIESAALHYKILNRCIRIDHQFEITADSHDHNTRNRERVLTPMYRTNYGKNSVIRASVIAFRKLPIEIQNSANARVFREGAKNYMLRSQ